MSDGSWGMGSVVRGAGGSTGSNRIENWDELAKDGERRLRENSPAAPEVPPSLQPSQASLARLEAAHKAAGRMPQGTMNHSQWLLFAELYNAAEAVIDSPLFDASRPTAAVTQIKESR